MVAARKVNPSERYADAGDFFLSAPLYFMEISQNCTRILSDARAVASASVTAPVFYGNFAKIQWRPTLRYPTLAPLRRIALLN